MATMRAASTLELLVVVFSGVLVDFCHACHPQDMNRLSMKLPEMKLRALDPPPLPIFNPLLSKPEVKTGQKNLPPTPSQEMIKDKILGAQLVKQTDVCQGAYVVAITLTPYSTNTIEQNRESLHKNLQLLENFTGQRLSSFGSFEEESVNYEGFFAQRFTFKKAEADCEDMKDFTTKAVSYSDDVERAIYMCKCGEIVMISKIHN